jgi:arginyl-tRNA synthetase
MIREKIKKLIQKSIKELQRGKIFPEFEISEIKIEHPEERIHGDYSTNVAMVICRSGLTLISTRKDAEKLTPIEVAEILVTKLKGYKESHDLFEKIEAVSPGFINFFLSKEFLQKQVREALKDGEKFGQSKIGKNIKTNVEFISANPTGQLHIGNGRGAFWGDCLANVLEKAGFKVTREYYINEAKTNTQIKLLGQTALGKGTTYLNEYLKSKIEKIKDKLNKIKEEGEAGYLLAKEIQKDIKEFVEKKLKIKFDQWFPDTKLYQESRIEKIFNWLKEKNYLYQKEGAWWIKTSNFGDNQDWVIIRSKKEGGEPTYFLCDIAYHKNKIDRGFKKIIDIWGADHQGHVRKMKAAMKMIGFKGDLDLLITQIVRVKGLKISKRKGEIIPLEDLLNEVGLDVARFFYLQKSLDTQMEFDLKLAKEQSEKNPVYYIQYAHTRICGILRKFGKSKIQNPKSQTNSKSEIQNSKLRLLNHPSELELIKQLIRFPEVIEDCARDYQLQRIPQYALDLATVFHQFYRDCKVLTETRSLAKARLALVLATKQVIKNTLDLMGISAPERM